MKAKQNYNFKDLTGMVFGRLTVLRRGEDRVSASTKLVVWDCVCECGARRTVYSSNLTYGRTKSCGCLLKEISTRHGWTNHPLHKTWRMMLGRCYSPNVNGYAHYGGRGIEVCARWKDDFAAFVADMGPKPTRSHTVHRLDNDKGYCPENCVWANVETQANYKTNSVLITYGEVTRSLSQWARRFNVTPAALRFMYRRRNNWDSVIAHYISRI